MPARLEKFGKIEVFKKSYSEWEFKIAEGFSGKARDTFDLQEICMKIAGPEYKYVKKYHTGKNLFHLILTKLSKNKS